MSQTRSATQPGSHARVSLSAYFPQGTQYFYGYPVGEDSQFLNKVPPSVDELVAARALCCAGPEVSVVSFASTAAPEVDQNLLQALAIPVVSEDHLTLLPKSIDITLNGKERNEAIMTALAESVAPGSLVMAQPYDNKELESLYEIPPRVTIWVNDKANMSQYIKPEMMPARLADYTSGAAFAADTALISRADLLPCVVKVSSSSSGDGVYICQTIDDVINAQAAIASTGMSVFVERYVEMVKNYAVHFGIPHDETKPIDIIGFNEQLTTDDGEFLGGIISGDKFPPVLAAVKHYLQTEVLPVVRSKGWYGVGGFDVVIDSAGAAYLIDGNFRMTGMSAYHFLIANGDISLPMVSFSGKFRGTQQEFEQAVLPLAGKDSQERIIRLIALSHHGDQWDFNGALMYQQPNDLKALSRRLIDAGISSAALELLV